MFLLYIVTDVQIGMDFQKLRPSKSDCMASKGPTVMERTLSLMKQQKQMVGYLKKKMVDWLNQLPKAPEDDEEDGNSATSSMHCALVIWLYSESCPKSQIYT